MAVCATLTTFLSPQQRRRPFVTPLFEGTKINSLVDTGSNISLISVESFRKLEKKKRAGLKRLAGTTAATSASGGPLQIVGIYEMSIELFTKTFKFPVHVVNNMKGEAILGIDFMRHARLVVDSETSQCYFKDQVSLPKTAAVMTVDSVFVKAGSVRKVQLKALATKGSMAAVMGISSSFQVKHTPNFQADDALVKTDGDGKFFTYIANTGTQDYRIPRGKQIGEFTRVDSVQHPMKAMDEIINDIPSVAAPPNTKSSPNKERFIKEKANVNHLEGDEKEALLELLLKNHDVISEDEFDLGNCQTLTHKLHLKQNHPVYNKQFPIPSAHFDEVNRFVDSWLKLGLVKPINSEFNSPVFLVPKKSNDGTVRWRCVCDFRGINEVCFPSSYRLPLLTECLERIGKAEAKFFSSIDLRSGFHQLPLHSESQHLTSFTIPGRGQFCWTRAPMGLRNVPLSFMRLMDIVFRNFAPNKLVCYIDDLLLMSQGIEDTIQTLQNTFDRLRAHGLKINLNKSFWHTTKLDYLGVEITPDGYRPGESKTAAVEKAPPPTSTKMIRSFTGLCNFFRGSICNYSKIAAPLTALTRKDSGWTGGELPAKAKEAFFTLKKLLCSRPILAFPKSEGKYHLFVDAALGNDKGEEGGLGAILMQDQEGKMKVIQYASCGLEKHEKNYTPYLLEIRGMAWAIEYFRVHLLGRKFTVYTDHKPAVKLSKVHTRTFNRLQELLLSYDFELKYFEGIKHPSDWISRNHVDSVEVPSTKPILGCIERSLLRKLQQKDEICQAFLNFIQTKTVPANPYLKSLVTRLGNKVFVLKDIVYLQLEREGFLPKRVVMAPQCLHAEIIVNAHGQFYTGHGGIWKTTEKILSEWWWPNVQEDVKETILQCQGCQKSNRKTYRNAPMGTFEEGKAPLEIVHTDLFGPLREHNGKKYILVVTDFATKFTKFVAITDKTPETVAEALFTNFIAEYGCPAVVVSDQDKCFCSKMSHQLFNLLGVDKRRTTAFHPQCNSSSERRNSHIIKYLTSLLENNPLEWEKLLPAMQLSYNCAVHKSTKQTPFMLMHGVHPRAPFLDPNQTEKVFYGDDYIAELQNRLKLARELARKNCFVYKQKYSSSYDKNVNTWFKLKEGDLAWLHRPEVPKINPKIQSPWQGPYVIINLVGSQNAFVQDLQTQKTRYVHVDRLKPYISTPSNTVPVPRGQTSGNESAQKESEEGRAQLHLQAEKRPQFVEFDDDEVILLSSPQKASRHRPLLQPKSEPSGQSDDSDESGDSEEEETPAETEQVRYQYVIPRPIETKQKKTTGQKVKSFARQLHQAAEDVIIGTHEESRITGPHGATGSPAATSSSGYYATLPAAQPAAPTALTRSHAARQAITLPPAGAPPSRPPEYRPRRGHGVGKKQD